MRPKAVIRARTGPGAYDDPERRPLGERCLLGFGSTSGPPALPNYFYNNLHQIVQTQDSVMILTEMVHDARIIRMNAPAPAKEHPEMDGRLHRALGRRHAGRRNDELQRRQRYVEFAQALFVESSKETCGIRRDRRFTRVGDERAALSIHDGRSIDLGRAVDW